MSYTVKITDHINAAGNAIASVRPFPLYLWNWLTIDLKLLHVSRSLMTTARRELKVKVKVVGQANVVGLTSIEGSFFLVYCYFNCSA